MLCEERLLSPEAGELPAYLALLDACLAVNQDRDDRSEGGPRPEVDRIFKATGRTVPQLAYSQGRRAGGTQLPAALLTHVFGEMELSAVFHAGHLSAYDRRLLAARGVPLEVDVGGACVAARGFTALRLRQPLNTVNCLSSLLESIQAHEIAPSFVEVELRASDLGLLVSTLLAAGYQYFKVSRLDGLFGDQAGDWRLGLAWRNFSVAGDALALRRAKRRRFSLHAALPAAKRLALCLSGQLRGRSGVEDLRWVRRFQSFDAFAVVPMEDCRRARELLTESFLQAEVLCVDGLFMSPEELRWLSEAPKADPAICPGHHCVYVWRDVETCGRLLRRHMARFRRSYWRVVRMRLDLHMEIFPQDVAAAFADEETIWAYAIPDRQWIAMPDRFALGPQQLMLDVYFTTYTWMLARESWQHYDPFFRPACQRRGHLLVVGGRVEALAKTWPCPEHSARGLAYPGPENVLEARLLTYEVPGGHGVAFRLRRDICFSQGDNFCERVPIRHRHGYWMNGRSENWTRFVSRQAAVPGSEKLETRLLGYDATFAARLAEFLFEQWAEAPPKVLVLGAGRGALAEQLGRWGLPVAAVDGNCLVHFTSGHGLCADLMEDLGLAWRRSCEAPNAKSFCSWLHGPRVDWAVALNLVRDIPRFLMSRLAAALRHGRGIILSWTPRRPCEAAKMRRLRELLHRAGYRPDRSASRQLRIFGGLLCCPWNEHALVLRRQRERFWGCGLQPKQLPHSAGCVFGQNYGCVEGGVWAHFGCRARFGAVACSSEWDYTECPWQGPAPLQRRFSRPQRSVPVARALQRSDLSQTNRVEASVNSSRFTRLFGLPLSWLYDAMDPLTTTAGEWSGKATGLCALCSSAL
ncbi:unnamed protein product [Effrenium voratum]|uniref:Uncharacterized protein n=1 Tax=Effrenium voratum TaxID=2562239 RepID=A0AA36NFZ6_9DINO|nr:unnamed protein product [Effrenium voratum]